MKYVAEKNGMKLVVEQDMDAESPRESDTLSKMVCFHNRYDLGDKHDYDYNDYGSWVEMRDAISKKEDVAMILPLYLYDHSGITISHTSSSCRWDSGQVGWIFMTKETARANYGVSRISKKRKDRIKKDILCELKSYDEYLRGDVYGFILSKDGEEIDSCWGFFGTDFKTNGILDYVGEELEYLIDALQVED